MINEEKRVGGYGVVRKAQLRASSFLPTWFASRRYGRPQVVAVKEIKLSPLHDASDLKRVRPKVLGTSSGVNSAAGK